MIGTFWSRAVTDIRVLVHSKSKIHEDLKLYQVPCVLNCFKYFLILRQNVSKNLDKKDF